MLLSATDLEIVGKKLQIMGKSECTPVNDGRQV